MSTTKPRTAASDLCPELLANPRLHTSSINGNVLATILNAKVEWLARKQQEFPLASFKDTLAQAERSFYDHMSKSGTRFILECKKASPSKGLIRPEFVPEDIARIYNQYAAAISVLADEKFFQGDYSYIARVHAVTSVPVLCKDFIFDPFQIYLARKNNADAVLLMLSVLTDEAYQELSSLAQSLGMGVLTEASTALEIERAITLGAKVIGINNRNLRDLTVDLNRVKELAPLVPSDRIVISESGIYTHDQVLELKKFARGFLVGSSLTQEPNIELACRKLILGQNKVCGLTRLEDLKAAWAQGACMTGFIFARASKRYITPENAHELATQARKAGCAQDFCGVFCDEEPTEVARIATLVPLEAVQLHGSESLEYIKNLRTLLPAKTRIFKAVPVSTSFPEEEVQKYQAVTDLVVLDTKVADAFGGTGQTFDWHTIKGDKSKLLVAGGLNPDNVVLAQTTAMCVGLDLNSGLEDAPGRKNHELLKRAFDRLKNNC